jgi:hypothetical protein
MRGCMLHRCEDELDIAQRCQSLVRMAEYTAPRLGDAGAHCGPRITAGAGRVSFLSAVRRGCQPRRTL